MSVLTDGKLRVATEQNCQAAWGGTPGGERFRCYLCGHRFKPGDKWRFVYLNSTPGYNLGNALACEKCDCPDIVERFIELGKMLRRCAWWLPEQVLPEPEVEA
jgi:hypothetical protein